YTQSNDSLKSKEYAELISALPLKPTDKGPFFHGTKAALQPGDFLTPGFNSNYQSDLIMNHIYFTAIQTGAALASTMAKGETNARVYIVQPTGNFENDPNVTDKKFPGNLTRSFRTAQPLMIIGEVMNWQDQLPAEAQQWRDKIINSKGQIIN
ncbi:MAG: NAD(+)--rifampin ADP-ribosyltransferase, partial [Pedobacter sp.]